MSVGSSLLIEGRGDLVECALFISPERSEAVRGEHEKGEALSVAERKGIGEGRGERHTETVAKPCPNKCLAFSPKSPVDCPTLVLAEPVPGPAA